MSTIEIFCVARVKFAYLALEGECERYQITFGRLQFNMLPFPPGDFYLLDAGEQQHCFYTLIHVYAKLKQLVDFRGKKPPNF